MRNVKQIIDGHNKALQHKQEGNSQQERPCNCRIRKQCPLDGKCLKLAVIYQAAVTANENMHQETYIDLTETSFKTRYNNHKVTFRNEAKKSLTELSNYIWSLVNNGRSYTINWKLVRESVPYSDSHKICNLCV